MKLTPELLYKEAHDAYHCDHDPDFALGLYRQIIEQFPSSMECKLSAADIAAMRSDSRAALWKQLKHPLRDQRIQRVAQMNAVETDFYVQNEEAKVKGRCLRISRTLARLCATRLGHAVARKLE